MARQETRGRKDGTERVRELGALLGSLSEVGDTISLDAISLRLGISRDEARTMMDIICMASGEETGGLLISSNDDETEYTLQYLNTRGRALRLTTPETMAVLHALDLAGVDESDQLRIHLAEALTSPKVLIEEVRRSLGAPSEDPSLIACAQSQAQQRLLSFRYQGIRDAEPRVRTVLVRRLRLSGEHWHVDAFDTVIEQDRTFRIDRMSEPVLGDPACLPQEDDTEHSEVQVAFNDMKYLTMFDWPGLRITSREAGVIHGILPYYDNGSTWLLRRICACRKTLVVEDERIMQAAREYAREQANRMDFANRD